MARIAYFDCASGISGDMTLGALIDAGASIERIQSAVQSLGLDIQFSVEEVKKRGFRALQLQITHPPEHAHRHLHHIDAMIDQATGLSDRARRTAKEIFLCVGNAEAKVHGSTLQKVHFHEVGAIDSIADIVGTAVALEDLEIDAILASPVPTGTGFIEIAHGRVSVPAPATAEILVGVPIQQSDVPYELTTPTGAAILKSLCRQYGPMPSMMIQQVGYGSGMRDLEQQANILRVLIGEPDVVGAKSLRADSGLESDQVVVLETNVDDISAESLADTSARLFHAGAIDVYQTPCTMKKGRLGVQLSVMCNHQDVATMERLLFLHAETIGIRRQVMDRTKLPRHEEVLSTAMGDIKGKTVRLPDGSQRFRVEFDDAQRIASEKETTVESIRREAQLVWSAQHASGT